MARIFTISFSFQGEEHSAIASVRTTPFYTEYTLGMLPDHLTSLLPGNRIVSIKPGQFQFLNATDEHSRDLMDVLIKAVSEHLSTVQA